MLSLLNNSILLDLQSAFYFVGLCLFPGTISVWFSFSFFFFFFASLQQMEFLGQGSDLLHSCTLCHSCGTSWPCNPLHGAWDQICILVLQRHHQSSRAAARFSIHLSSAFLPTSLAALILSNQPFSLALLSNHSPGNFFRFLFFLSFLWIISSIPTASITNNAVHPTGHWYPPGKPRDSHPNWNHRSLRTCYHSSAFLFQ